MNELNYFRKEKKNSLSSISEAFDCRGAYFVLPLVVQVIGMKSRLNFLEELSRSSPNDHFIERKVALRRIMIGLSSSYECCDSRNFDFEE